jgi:hypothetical protein
MSSTLYVDKVVEKTSAAGVHIAGHVVQVVRSSFTAPHNTTTSTSYVSMGSPFNLAITPKFSNSIILIDVMLNPYVAGNSNSGSFNIHNGSGQLGHASNGFGIVPGTGGSNGQYRHFNINASDTASSTSTITYQIYHRSDNASVTFYGNHANFTNHIRLTEIAQ